MLIVGNGESRKGIDVPYNSIGCNALYRDFQTKHLVCCDKKMVREALTSNVPNIYTRQRWQGDWQDNRVKALPELPYIGTNRQDESIHWGSGPYAVLLGCLLSNELTLVGFDLYGIDNKLNNIYKDTKNYGSSTKNAIDPSYWIYQISKLFTIYTNKQFTIKAKSDWILPKEWQKPNITVDFL